MNWDGPSVKRHRPSWRHVPPLGQSALHEQAPERHASEPEHAALAQHGSPSAPQAPPSGGPPPVSLEEPSREPDSASWRVPVSATAASPGTTGPASLPLPVTTAPPHATQGRHAATSNKRCQRVVVISRVVAPLRLPVEARPSLTWTFAYVQLVESLPAHRDEAHCSMAHCRRRTSEQSRLHPENRPARHTSRHRARCKCTSDQVRSPRVWRGMLRACVPRRTAQPRMDMAHTRRKETNAEAQYSHQDRQIVHPRPSPPPHPRRSQSRSHGSPHRSVCHRRWLLCRSSHPCGVRRLPTPPKN
jgi:hypothetical protein